MVTCEICGKEFKNTQGLRGHRNFVHGNSSHSADSATQAASELQLSKLEERLEKLEYITGLTEESTPDNVLSNNKPLSEKLVEVTEQLNHLTQQLASLSSNSASNRDLHNIGVKISQLTQQLSSYSKWFQPVSTVAGTMSRLEDELSDRAQNTRVNALENRLRYLEEESKNAEGNIDKRIKENKAFTDTQIKKVMEIIEHVVDKLAPSIKQLQDQLREQKQVTDWVKKEYNLRPVKKSK